MNLEVQTFVLHLVESTLWCGLLLLLLAGMNIKDSLLRCWVHRVCLIKFVVPTIYFSSLFSFTAIDEMMPAFVVLAYPVDTITSVAKNQSMDWVSYAWISGISGFFLFGLLTILRVHQRMKFEQVPFETNWNEVLTTVFQSMNLGSRQLEGYVVENGPTIALYGVFRPRIIAKRSFLELLNEEELASAFQHEIAHWIRKDHLWRMFAEVVLCLFWFHPLVWFSRKQMFLETEKSCDEYVLASGRTIDSYASCLLKAAEFSYDGNQFGAIALSETSLKRRVSNVIQYEKGNISIMKTSAIILTSLTLFGGSFALFAAKEVKEVLPVQQVYEMKNVMVKPQPTIQVPPTYPKSLKEAKINGTVHLLFILNKEGIPENVRVEKSTHVDFEQPSIDALEQWRFTPGEINGKAVKVRVRAPMVFKVNGPPIPAVKLKESSDPADIKSQKSLKPKSAELSKAQNVYELSPYLIESDKK